MIYPRLLTNTFFALFLVMLISCNSKPKKEIEVVKDDVEQISEEEKIIIEEIDSVLEKFVVIPVAPTLFDLAQKQPIFPSCIQRTQASKNLCFKKKVNQHIEDNLIIAEFLKQNVPVGYQKVPYSFVIDKNGNIKRIVVDAIPIVANNIKQSLMQLPKMIPGTNNSQAVEVKYTDEITFFVGKQVDNGEVEMEVGGVTIKANIPSNLTMHMVDRAPIFPGCEGKTGVPLIKCTSSKINNYIGNNINKDNLKGKNLPQGNQKLSIYFTITKQGNIADVSVQNPHEALKEEVTRVVKSIPKMSPALYEKVKVPVNYKVTLTTNIKMND